MDRNLTMLPEASADHESVESINSTACYVKEKIGGFVYPSNFFTSPNPFVLRKFI
jgi:hypothetical protein